MTVGANSTANLVGVTVKGFLLPWEKVGDGGIFARTVAGGLDGYDGNDSLLQAGTLTVNATSNSTVTDFGLTVVQLGTTDYRVRSGSLAIGLDGGLGNDWIRNEGTTKTSANSTTNRLNVGFSAADIGVLSDNDLSTVAEATSIGVLGDEGKDTLENTGTVRTDTSSGAYMENFQFDLFNLDLGFIGAADAAARTEARSETTGMAGGEHDDRITNSGTVDANASSSAFLFNLDVAWKSIALSFLELFGVEFGDAKIDAQTDAIGLDGGEGNDKITNESIVKSIANANAHSVGLGIQIDLAGIGGDSDNEGDSNSSSALAARASGQGDSGDDPPDVICPIEGCERGDEDELPKGFNGNTVARTTAIGIDGGLGHDNLANSGAIDAFATSRASVTNVSVGVGIVEIFEPTDIIGFLIDPVPVDYVNASVSSGARAVGMFGGNGDDMLYNSGSVHAKADAFTNSVSAILDIQAVGIGFPMGGHVTRSVVESETWTAGLHGGLGDDSVVNEGTVFSESIAGANATDVSVIIGGAIGGLPINVAASDSSTTTDAISFGIRGGSGDDKVFNLGEGEVKAHATSKAFAESVSVDFKLITAISNFGGALSKATTNASSSAVGLDGGWGKDKILNEAILESKAISESSGTSVSVKATGASSMNLANIGAVFADTSTTASANSIGIDGSRGEDVIVNGGNLKSEAKSTLRAASVSVETSGINVGSVITGGAALARTTQTANSNAVGITGGEDDDRIENLSSVHSISTVDATSGTVSVLVDIYGAALTDTSLTATAEATAIDGSSGDDKIANHDSIIVENTSTARAADVSVNLVNGFASASVGTTAIGNVTGIGGGSGSDSITNTGTIWLDNKATAQATDVSVDILGVASGFAGPHSQTNTVGIDLGDAYEGSNWFYNEGKVEAFSTSSSNSSGTTVVIGGYSYSNASTTATSETTGVRGGSDLDKIWNNGLITATSDATSTGGTVNVNIAGYAPADATATATASSAGIDTDAGNDRITNTGTLMVNSTSKASAGTVSVEVVGVADADVGTTSSASAVGIDGGDGTDKIANEGNIVLTSSATTDATDASVNVFGVANSAGAINATAAATGVEGGLGNDRIWNSGNITATGSSTMILKETSFEFGGAALAGGVLTADNAAHGLSGGAGNDTLTNDGTLTINANSELESSGNIKAIFGYSAGGGSTGATSVATGMDGGEGDDQLNNRGFATVTATSKLVMNGSAYDFGGANNDVDTLNASTRAVGLSGGNGSNYVGNEGTLAVVALSDLEATGGANVTLGASSASSKVTATTSAVGLEGGVEEDRLQNHGDIEVSATSIATSDKSSYVFGGGTSSHAVLSAASNATGIDGNAGADKILNTGSVTVRTSSDLRSTGGSSASFAGKSAGSGNVTATSIARGIHAGDGDDFTENRGEVLVEAKSFAYAKHDAQSGIVFGHGDARTTAGSSVAGYGIDMGAGNGKVLNSGDISVFVAAEAVADADSAGAKIIDGDVYSEANTTVDAKASGIFAGNGKNRILNLGRIDVQTMLAEMASNAYSDASANAGGIGGDGRASSTAVIESFATGIEVGDGDNCIENRGEISVLAVAHSTSSAWADSGWFGSVSTTEAGRISARGFGILTGNGNNYVVNDGDISVTGSYSTNLSAFQAAPVADAYGIKTGSGDDVIINNGNITTTSVRNSEIRPGVGIDSGAGNDEVHLRDASSVSGSVELGADDDKLFVADTAAVSLSIDGGSGDDALIFDGTGNLDLSYVGFERAFKKKSGTFKVTDLPPMQELVVLEGVLQIGGDYLFYTGQSLEIDLNGHGTSGKLMTGGTATLGGTITIGKGGGAFRDGQRFEVVKSEEPLRSFFEEVKLPKPTPLLSFAMEKADDSISVTASSKNFGTVATNKTEKRVARFMDDMMPSAKGQFADVLGQFQSLQTPHFAKAFSGMNPGYHGSSTQASADTSRQYAAAIRDRVQLVRSGIDTGGSMLQLTHASDNEALLFASNSSEVVMQQLALLTDQNRERRAHNLWLQGFGKWGNNEGSGGGAEFDFDVYGLAIGADRMIDDQFIVGLSLGFSNTDVEHDDDLGDIDITGILASLYGSFFTERYFIEGALSYGRLGYESERNITVGADERTAKSDHDADQFSAFVSGGYNIHAGSYLFQPFVSLQYTRTSEEHFAEHGAGALNMDVKGRNADSLISELGVRAVRPVELGTWKIIPELSAAWLYDYDIDSGVVPASFSGASKTTLTVDGVEPKDHGAVLGAAIRLLLTDRITTSLSHTTELYSDQTAHELMGEVQFAF
ncbi:MAG: autotransporter domain-containing protein, partial [bacterium]|nr:autotransporter domain-containing protein [bacterium]